MKEAHGDKQKYQTDFNRVRGNLVVFPVGLSRGVRPHNGKT